MTTITASVFTTETALDTRKDKFRYWSITKEKVIIFSRLNSPEAINYSMHTCINI